MISVFGMNPKVGQVSFYGMQQDNFTKPYSDETAKLIDDEVRKLLNEQYERAKNLLKEKRNELEILARQLLDKEVLLKSDVEKLIGTRPSDEKVRQEQQNLSSEDNDDVVAEVANAASDQPN